MFPQLRNPWIHSLRSVKNWRDFKQILWVRYKVFFSLLHWCFMYITSEFSFCDHKIIVCIFEIAVMKFWYFLFIFLPLVLTLCTLGLKIIWKNILSLPHDLLFTLMVLSLAENSKNSVIFSLKSFFYSYCALCACVWLVGCFGVKSSLSLIA